MSEHDGLGQCRKKKLSRRFFVGGLGMAAAGTAAGLAFSKTALAALEDTVAEPVLSSVPELAAQGIESAIVQAAPKVHRGGAILLTYSGDNSAMEKRSLQSIANREGRMIIFRDDNGKVTTASPSGVALEDKWERPSLAFFPK